jgi:hypothetical protein
MQAFRPVVTAKLTELSAKLAEQFGRLVARCKAATDERELVTPRLKELLVKGDDNVTYEKHKSKEGNTFWTYTYAPASSPFMLVKTVTQKTEIKYKDEFEKLYLEHVGSADDLVKFYENFSTSREEKLEVKPNPAFKGAKGHR